MEAVWLDSNKTPPGRGRSSRLINCEGNGKMGLVKAMMLVANNQDVQLAARGSLPPDQVRIFQIQGIVDTAANWVVLPEAIATQLGLPQTTPMLVRFGDERMEARNVVEEVRVELLGRHGTFRAIVDPNRPEALIGNIVLEDLDLLVDCGDERLQLRAPQQVQDRH